MRSPAQPVARLRAAAAGCGKVAEATKPPSRQAAVAGHRRIRGARLPEGPPAPPLLRSPTPGLLRSCGFRAGTSQMYCLPGPAARDMHGTRGSKDVWIARSRTPSSPLRHRRRPAWPERRLSAGSFPAPDTRGRPDSQLEAGYTLTPVDGARPAEPFRMAGAEPRNVCEGPGEPVEQHQEFLDESGDCPESFLAGASPSGAKEASGPSPPSSAAIWRVCCRGAAPGRLRGRTCAGRSSATWAPVGKAAECGSRGGGMHAAKPAGRPARGRRRSRPAGFPLRERRICRHGLTWARGPLGPPGRGSASSGRRPPRPR
jgi:hypothetical protein